MLTVTADQLPRVMQCNGSRLMPPAFPTIVQNQAERDEGTAAHWLAHHLFRNGTTSTLKPGDKAPNNFVLTAEMFEHVEGFLSSLDIGEMEANTSWNGTGFEIRGRCDHRKFAPSINTLYVDDFKYGRRIVDPFEHWTLISHAWASVWQWGIQRDATVSLRIYQPRAYHPDGPLREWRISWAELESYANTIATDLTNITDQLRTGPQCGKCHALGACPAARAASMNAIDAGSPAFSDDLPNEALSYELDTLRQAEAVISNRLEALEELTMHRLRQGQVVQNYAMETQLANSRWKTGADPVIMKALTGVDLSKPGLVTPAEAKRRGVDKATIAAFTERPITGTKLKRIDSDTLARRLLKS